MLDAETLGVKCAPVLLSISAVAKIRGEEFLPYVLNRFVTAESQHLSSVSSSTIDFWFMQYDEARATQVSKTRVSITQALKELAGFICLLREDCPDYELLIWGNGAMADNHWLTNAAELYGIDLGIDFYAHRCLKTFVDTLHELGCSNFKRSTEFTGIPHNAIDDCYHQMAYMEKYFCALAKLNNRTE